MNVRQHLLLAFLGVCFAILVAIFQPAPGYMDADYYYATGLQLADGNGFIEPFIWNYLNDPAGLPQPSHAYWMPLTSLLVAAGSALFPPNSWWAARISFILLAAILPGLTASLAFRFHGSTKKAFLSGLFSLFSAFYLLYYAIPDTFIICLVLGAVFFTLVLRKASCWNSLFLGVAAGLMHLARADGLLWLLMASFAAFFQNRCNGGKMRVVTNSLFLPIAGYLLVMAPWFYRNLGEFGALFSPGGNKMLWLTSYNQIFAYPSDGITFSAWIASGVSAILKARLWALAMNLANAFSMQGLIFLWPLGCLGLWQWRRHRMVLLACLGWLIILLTMTLVFPFAGARGGFIHSGAALQAVWWVLTPIGVEMVVEWGIRNRGWSAIQARREFPIFVLLLAALLTFVVVTGRLGLFGGDAWGSSQARYAGVGQFLEHADEGDTDIVIVSNPPGFWLATHRSAIAIPDGNVETILALSQKYGANTLVLELESLPRGLEEVYSFQDEHSQIEFLDEVNGARIFAIRP